MDKTTLVGLFFGFGAILLGNLLEGGHLESLVQGTAAIIVIGGTLGATVLSSPSGDLQRALELFKIIVRGKSKTTKLDVAVDEIVDCARQAKKEGVVVLEKKVKSLKSDFTARIIKNIADGIDRQTVREIAEIEIQAFEAAEMRAVKVWNDAGGFAPTIGIIGAVLGLIHVMGNLTDTSKLGSGIAVAFVATVYGVGLANLVLLPFANKLKKHVQMEIEEKMILLEGCLLIGTEINPVVIEQKMQAALLHEKAVQ